MNYGCFLGIMVCALMLPLHAQESRFPAVDGFKLTEEQASYDPNNLWDIIDGAADLYLLYGFQDLHIARYTDTDSIEIKVEIYHHNTPVNAFGMYSQERDTADQYISVGTQGYMQDGILIFLTGSYYIKLSTFQHGQLPQQKMVTIARAVDKLLHQVHELPNELQYFPVEGRISHAEQFVAQSFLGYSFLNNAFVVPYHTQDAMCKLFLISSKTHDDAAAIAKLMSQAVGSDSVQTMGKELYRMHDPKNGFLMIAVVDHFVCGVNSDKEISHEQTLERMIALLRAK